MISGGRFLFGVGYGWRVEEMGNHRLAYKQRRDILRENLGHRNPYHTPAARGEQRSGTRNPKLTTELTGMLSNLGRLPVWASTFPGRGCEALHPVVSRTTISSAPPT